jgi:alanyl-tRNA synthetase
VTGRLYQNDSYKTEFDAVVSEVLDRDGLTGIVLDSTFFYPESGGQPCDTGTIGGVPVESVVEEGDAIIHILGGKPGFGVGDRVECVVDWARRFTNMQQHTGQHILSQAFERVLGARTVSSALGTEHSTIDVSRLDLKWEDMERVEVEANRIVYENRPVKIYEASREDAGDLRVKRDVGRDLLRVVEVDGFDRSPCGGTHLRTTGETGLIKILRWEKVRDTTRVEFICGGLAQADYFWKNRFIVDLAQRLTTKDANLPGLVDAVLDENKALRKEIARLKSDLAGCRVHDLMKSAEEVAGKRLVAGVFDDMELDDLRRLAAGAVGAGCTVALFCARGGKARFVFSRSDDVNIDMREAMEAACAVAGGRGGGKPEVAQGGSDRPDLADRALAAAMDLVRRRAADIS